MSTLHTVCRSLLGQRHRALHTIAKTTVLCYLNFHYTQSVNSCK